MTTPTERDREMARELYAQHAPCSLECVPCCLSCKCLHEIDAWAHSIARARAEGYARGREEVARWIMQEGYATGHGDNIPDLLAELRWQIGQRYARGKAEMKERAAKVALDYPDECYEHANYTVVFNVSSNIFAAIRALED